MTSHDWRTVGVTVIATVVVLLVLLSAFGTWGFEERARHSQFQEVTSSPS
jgi:uncharacterized membrane protein YqjE